MTYLTRSRAVWSTVQKLTNSRSTDEMCVSEGTSYNWLAIEDSFNISMWFAIQDIRVLLQVANRARVCDMMQPSTRLRSEKLNLGWATSWRLRATSATHIAKIIAQGRTVAGKTDRADM